MDVVIDRVVQEYPGFTLGPVTLSLSGGVTGLVGPNGAGKSTLMRMVAGIEKPLSGTISFLGETCDSVLKTGFLPQDFAAPRLSRVDDFLHYAAWCSGVESRSRGSSVQKALEAVDLVDRARSRCGRLSGGMIRRLGIAQAIVHDPMLVILDEPTVGLDPFQKIELRKLLRGIGERHSVLLSSHSGDDIGAVAEDVVVLNVGRQIFNGKTDQLVLLGRDDDAGDTPLERALSRVLTESQR